MLPSRLYAILDIDLTTARGLEPARVLDAWLAAGVRLIQLRAKSTPSGALLDMADRFGARARSAGATFLINDRADIARMAAADGVHVGQDDLPPRQVRRVMGAASIVGLSTHTMEELTVAVAELIDYVAVGAVYATTSKPPGHPVVGLDGVRRAAEAVRARALPIVGIGGITLHNARDVIQAGASAVAVISDLLVGDVATRAKAYLTVLA